MQNRTLIFNSVLSELVESFTPFMNDFFKSFQAQYRTQDNKKVNIILDGNEDISDTNKTFFEDLFKHFPRCMPTYKEMIQKLTILGSSDVRGTIHYLTKLVKEALNANPTKQFTLLQMAKTFPNISNKGNYILFFYTSNIFIADLICQIMVNYYSKQTNKPTSPNSPKDTKDTDDHQIGPDVTTYLTRTAYNIASSKPELPNTSLLVLRQWSVILSLLSEYDFNDVSQIFSMFQNSNDLTNALVLMQYVRFDINNAFSGVFFDVIVQSVRAHIRKKTITNEGLVAVSKMIVTIPFNEELFTKLYQTVRPLRKDKNMKYLWPGSVILSCALFMRLPNKRNRSKFLQKQILNSCSDLKKLETSLICFSMIMIGRNTDLFWENWEWGFNPRANKYTYLHLNSACDVMQDDPRSFTNIFMSNYFVKSDFHLFPKIVKHILLHLASLDFVYFTSFVVPQFIELDDDDPRFATLLKIVPKVNSQVFWDHAFKTPNNVAEQIKKFNKALRQKVLNALKLCVTNLNNNSSENFESESFENAICFREKDVMIDSLLSEADQKVSSILEEWKILNNFSPNRVRFKLSKYPKDKYSLIDSLFPTLKLILDENDFNSTTMMDIFIGCSYINDSIVATTSYDICKNVIPNLSNCETFIQMLIVAVTTNEDYESVYTCLSIIESALHSVTSNLANNDSLSNSNNSYYADESISTDSSTEKDSSNENEVTCSISKKLIIDIEVMAFIVLSFEHPAIRHLGLVVLQTVNSILNGHGLLSYLKRNFSRIEKDVKDHIFLQSELVNYDDKFSNKNTMYGMKSKSTTRISFETAILSHYHDVWIFFVSAMMNVLIESNYQPFFKHIKILVPSLSPLIFDGRTIRESEITEMIIMLSSMFYTKSIVNSERYINSKQTTTTTNNNNNNNDVCYYENQYTSYSDCVDERATVCAFVAKLLSDDFDDSYSEVAFHIIPHLHFSILGSLIDVLSNVPQKKLPRATQTLSHILRLPEIDNYFIIHNFRRITSFVNTINTYLLENQLNTPRIMAWTKNQIRSLLSNILLAFDYCNIIYTTFRVSKVMKDENCWPIATREVVFRFLVNWAIAAYNISDSEINHITSSSIYSSPSASHSASSLNSNSESSMKEPKHTIHWWKNIINKVDSAALLFNLREYAKLALVTLCKVGPTFTHTPLFDDLSVHFLGSIELSGMPILSNIINFHFDIIIDDYIKACYTQPTLISEAFFDAIVDNITAEHGDSIVSKSGEILLLVMVFVQREHTRANELVDRFLNIAFDHELVILPKSDTSGKNILENIINGIISSMSNLTNISLISGAISSDKQSFSNHGTELVLNEIHRNAYLLLVPQIFTFAAEAVFKALFTIIDEYKYMSVSFKDVINAARVWTSVIRLLPKQHTCVQVFVPPQFNFFTPYQFLAALAHITENIDEDRGKLFFTIWEDLAKAPDHREIIPIYLANMVNSKSMQGIFQKLLDFFPDNVLPLIDERCSFAYFFHCTKCLNEEFNLSSSGWGSSFLCHVFENNFENILSKLPTILHFVLIFRERGLEAPFRSICKRVCIECPEDSNITNKDMRSIVHKLVTKFSSPQYKKFSIENWGNECLKWLFACDDTHLASLSFLIYNEINSPYDPSIFHYQVIRTVSYHIDKYIIDQSHSQKNMNSNLTTYLVSPKNDLSLLIDESFIFFSKHNDGEDILIYNYISSFLDSQIVPHLELIGAIHFFMRAFRQPEILLLVCQNIITLVRPLISMIEADRNVQELINKCVEIIDNEDVKMIVAPLKKAHPSLFPHLPPAESLLKNASVNAMCNALVHYSMLAETSSKSVLNGIFEIAASIVMKVYDENNLNPLTRLYQMALRSLATCPAAFTLVTQVAERQPEVASNEIVDSFVWTRSLGDVNRSIKLVLAKMKCGSFSSMTTVQGSAETSGNNGNNMARLTDCHSYRSVLSFLYLREDEEEEFNENLIDEGELRSNNSQGVINQNKNVADKAAKSHSHSPRGAGYPRIMPFAAQKEMIEGMRKVKTRMKKERKCISVKKEFNSGNSNEEKTDSHISSIPNSTSIVFNSIAPNSPTLRRHSHSGKSKKKNDSKSGTDSDNEDTDNPKQTVICEPNFATVYGSLIQFPTFGLNIGNGSEGESILSNLSPLRHPKKIILSLPSNAQNSAQSLDDVDRNILEEEIERSRKSAFTQNLTANDFFRDGFARRRSSSSVITT